MPDLLKQFSEASEKILSNKKPIRTCVYSVYRDHLSDISPDDLPEDIQPIFDALINRLTSVEPPGDIGVDEAGYLAKDILYITDVIRADKNPS